MKKKKKHLMYMANEKAAFIRTITSEKYFNDIIYYA